MAPKSIVIYRHNSPLTTTPSVLFSLEATLKLKTKPLFLANHKLLLLT